MVYGARTLVPFGIGIVASFFFSFFFYNVNNYKNVMGNCSKLLTRSSNFPHYIYSAEHWQVKLKKPIPNIIQSSQKGKVTRSRFAATELGIRERLVVIIFGQSSLSLVLNSLISPHVSMVQIFIDASRVDTDLGALPNLILFRQNGQHAHVHVLNAIYNLTFHDKYDWFFLVPDSTYVNPFQLNKLIDNLSWNKPLAIGHSISNGKCVFQGGILLSNPAIQILLQERNLCGSIVATSDNLALEMCIQQAANLSCQPTDFNFKNGSFDWWRFEDGSETGLAIHERVAALCDSEEFNSSLTVSLLLSDLDARALHEHFISVEIEKVDIAMQKLSVEIREMERDLALSSAVNQSMNTITTTLLNAENHDASISWPTGLPEAIKPINRYQVLVWEFFTETKMFKNWPNKNMKILSQDDALDISEILSAARQKIETSNTENLKFLRLRNGYRTFNALRGMEYIVDLEYSVQEQKYDDFGMNYRVDDGIFERKENNIIVRRVHLCRPIFSTELIDSVPYVKEDTDITIVIPVETSEEIQAARLLFSRHALICNDDSYANTGDNRLTRIILAARSLDQLTYKKLNNDLNELKKKCKLLHTETALLVLKPTESTEEGLTNSQVSIRISAMDEAVNHYGHQLIYVLISPYSDYQHEFLDRVRISTIRRYQAFFPISFAEFNPLFANSDKLLKDLLTLEFNDKEFGIKNELWHQLGEKIRNVNRILKNVSKNIAFENQSISIHKDYGFFDTDDFSVLSVYGSDYLAMRKKNSLQTNNDIHNANNKIIKKDIKKQKKNVKTDSGENQNEFKYDKISQNNEKKIFDVIDLFINQAQIHVLRTIEPSIRLRYYKRTCSTSSSTNANFNVNNNGNQGVWKNNLEQSNLNINNDQEANLLKSDLENRCESSQKNVLGTKSQMTNLVFRDIKSEVINNLDSNNV